MIKADLKMLSEIKEHLETRFEVSIRGEGLSSFLFITNGGRIVEISQHKDGWWLEFWEATDDEGIPANREMTVAHTAEAIQEAIRWLAS